MTDMPSVRIADASDEDEIMSLCRLLHEENGLFDMDEGKVRNTLRMAFAKKGGMCGVIGAPGKIEGVIYLLISQFWYSNDWHLEELFSFVHPDHRRSRNSDFLVEKAKEWAKALDMSLVIGIVSNDRVLPKVRLYRKRLGNPSGAFFVFNSKWTQNAEGNPDLWKRDNHATRGGRGARRRHNKERMERLNAKRTERKCHGV